MCCAYLFFLLLLFTSFLFPALLALGPFPVSIFIFTMFFPSMWGTLTRVRTTRNWSSPSALLSPISLPWPWPWAMLSSTFPWSRPWTGHRIISPPLVGGTSAPLCVSHKRPWPWTCLPYQSILSVVCCIFPSFVSIIVGAPWWSRAKVGPVSRHWSLYRFGSHGLGEERSYVGNQVLGAAYINRPCLPSVLTLIVVRSG